MCRMCAFCFTNSLLVISNYMEKTLILTQFSGPYPIVYNATHFLLHRDPLSVPQDWKLHFTDVRSASCLVFRPSNVFNPTLCLTLDGGKQVCEIPRQMLIGGSQRFRKHWDKHIATQTTYRRESRTGTLRKNLQFFRAIQLLNTAKEEFAHPLRPDVGSPSSTMDDQCAA